VYEVVRRDDVAAHERVRFGAVEPDPPAGHGLERRKEGPNDPMREIGTPTVTYDSKRRPPRAESRSSVRWLRGQGAPAAFRYEHARQTLGVADDIHEGTGALR
jgi:hypothetical protein